MAGGWEARTPMGKRWMAAAVLLVASQEAWSEVVQQWTPYEIALASDREYQNPLIDVTVRATLESPDGRERRVEAFWDGG